MKSCNEMVNSLMERLDAYEVRQKQKRKTVMRITSAVCAFAVVAAVGVGLWQGGVFDTEVPPVVEPSTGTTTAPTEDDGPGVGGDYDPNYCREHSFMYHHLVGFLGESIDAYYEYLGENYDPEDKNIVSYVEFAGVTREEFMEAQNWAEDELDEIAWAHGNGCPYTKRQWLDAIYGSDEELSEWVFSTNEDWPHADIWSLAGDKDFLPEDWPPEGYGFGETRPTTEATTAEPTTEPMTTETEAPSTTLRDWTGPAIPERDEFGNTTAPTTMP